ncbi:MAG: hypothetical protein U0905_15640 [Pirellulales bacterium]
MGSVPRTNAGEHTGDSPRGTESEIEKISQRLAALEMQLKAQNAEKASQDKASSKKQGDSASNKSDAKSSADPATASKKSGQ